MLVVAGSRSDQCPSGALNRTSGPALLAGGHRFGRQTGPHRQTLICVWAVGGGVAGSRSDQCPSGALNRTSGPALLDGGARCAPPSADAPGNLAIIATLLSFVGADSISARAISRCHQIPRANTVRPYAPLPIGTVGRGLDPSGAKINSMRVELKAPLEGSCHRR